MQRRSQMHTFSDSYTLGRFQPSLIRELAHRTSDPVSCPDRIPSGGCIFSFPNAFKEGRTPQQAYELFDIFVSAEA